MAYTINNIRDFKSLDVYNKIRELVKDVYKITEQFPPSEQYGATSQIRRAVTSIAANVAEGNGQFYPSKEITFLNTAIGSLSETRSWILFGLDMDYISKEDYDRLEAKCLEIIKMLYGCVRRIKQSQDNDDGAA
ncbi:MAG: four helix bundle protein [Firmicutes bacterium]|nr:four helix bundle protein [Bacillota bacterium]